MKRIYACILIVAALLAVSLYSSGRVQGFAQDISADLDCALEAVRQKDVSTARQALAARWKRPSAVQPQGHSPNRLRYPVQSPVPVRCCKGILPAAPPQSGYTHISASSLSSRLAAFLLQQKIVLGLVADKQ